MRSRLTNALLVLLAMAGSAWAVDPLTMQNGRVVGLISSTTPGASFGVGRFGNNDNLCWRNQGNSLNYCMSLSATDLFQFTAPLRITDQNSGADNSISVYGNSSAAPVASCAANGIPKAWSLMDTSHQNVEAARIWRTCYGQVDGPVFPQFNNGTIVTSASDQSSMPPPARFTLAAFGAAHFVEGLE